MKKRNFLTMANYKTDEIYYLLSKALDYKRQLRRGVYQHPLAGKTVALIFNKPSTRTRVSFESAVAHLGGTSVYLAGSDLQLGRGETIGDTGRTLSRYVNAIVIRTFAHAEVEALAAAATVPVINALTDDHHPCQALADIMTILEKKDRLAGIKLAYVGDGNNVCHSLLLASTKVGMNITVASPKGFEPDTAVVKQAKTFASDTNSVKITNIPEEAVNGADVVYTDVWTSMGQEEEARGRLSAFRNYQINMGLLALASPKAIVMHCLPAHRGEEISAEVIDGPQSVVFDQAENRLHAQKALLTMLMSDG